MKYLFILGLLIATPASATICAPRLDITHVLTSKYHEKSIGLGLLTKDKILEIWANSKTWTLMVTNTDNNTCVVAAGVHWINTGKLKE